MRSSTSSRVTPPVVHAEVVATERRLVVIEVAQEVHVLERGAEAPCAVDQCRFGDDRMPRPRVHEHLQAHQSDDLGRAVHVRVVRGGVVAPGGEVGAHGREERLARGSSPMPHSRAVRAKACTMRLALNPRSIARERLGFEVVEHRGSLIGEEAGRRGGAVDDLVRHAHQRVDVAHVGSRPGTEQPAGQGERRRVARR